MSTSDPTSIAHRESRMLDNVETQAGSAVGPSVPRRVLGVLASAGTTAVRALAVSVLATAVDVAATALLVAGSCGAGLATAGGGVAGAVIGFLAMRHWVFPGAAGRMGRQARRYALASALGALLNGLAVEALTRAGADVVSASVVGRSAVWLAWSMPSARLYVFPAVARPNRGDA